MLVIFFYLPTLCDKHYKRYFLLAIERYDQIAKRRKSFNSYANRPLVHWLWAILNSMYHITLAQHPSVDHYSCPVAFSVEDTLNFTSW